MSLTRHALRASVVAVAFWAGVLVSPPARAEDAVLQMPRARQGYYQAVGLLFDGVQHWENGRSKGMTLGDLFSLRFGQMLSPRWGLGVWIDFGSAEADGKSRDTVGVGMEGQFNLAGNLALHLGLGLGTASRTDPANLENKVQGSFGSVYSVSASWDVFLTSRLTGGWSIAPTMTVRYLPEDSLRGFWICGGAQVSHWSGRPRNELLLTGGEAYKP